MDPKDGILRVVNGNAVLYNTGNQAVRKYYIGGKATHVMWHDISKESVQVQLSTGEVYIINIGCQVILKINS